VTTRPALVLTLMALDVPAVAAGFALDTPRRPVAVVLGLLAVRLGGMWVAAVVRFATTGQVPAGSALVEPDTVLHPGHRVGPGTAGARLRAGSNCAVARPGRRVHLAAVVLVAGTLHQVSYLVALPFQAAAGIPGAVPFDPLEPVIALLYTAATVQLLWGAGRCRDGVGQAGTSDSG
jgi:hypothetical protein